MQKLRYTITIDAPRQKVWDVMLDDRTYRQWTALFDPHSRYEGSWEQGSDIRFLGVNEGGKAEGMAARIAENRPHEFISIQHLGEIKDGKPVDETPWENVFENYTFEDADGGTKLTVEVDSEDKYADMFNGIWPKALEKLKQLAEQA